MEIKKILLAVILLSLAQPVLSYTDLSLEVLVKVNGDGSSHVTEKTSIFMDNENELESFDYNAIVGTSISDWTRFSKNVKYHINGPVVSPKIAGRRIGVNTGLIILDYDISEPLFSINQTGSRIKLYSLKPGVLGFESSGAGETIVPKGTVLTIETPLDAEIVSSTPPASESSRTSVSWSATHGYVVGTWTLVFQREQSLSTEVNSFFLSLYDQLISLVAPVIILAIAALIVYKFVRKK